MTAKTQALVREIAALFVKYSLADWQPIIAKVEGGAGTREIAAAIRDLAITGASEVAAAKAAAAKLAAKNGKKAKIRPKAEIKQVEPQPFSTKRARILEPLRDALRERSLLISPTELKSVYQAIGIKEPQPSRREMVAEVIVRHLDSLPEDRFEDALALITPQVKGVAPQDGDSYARWFEMIRKSPS